MPGLLEHQPAPLRGGRRGRQGQGAALAVQAPDPRADERLAVREEGAAFFVVRAADRDDWLVRFDKSPDFPAREWAENMVRIYNRRLSKRSTGPPIPPGLTPSSYHPDAER